MKTDPARRAGVASAAVKSRRVGLLIGTAGIVVSSCSAGSEGAASPTPTPAATTVTTLPEATSTSATTGSTTPPSTTEPESTGRDEACVVAVAAGGSLSGIAAAEDLTMDALLEENRISVEAVLLPGDEFDVCIGNDVDDVTGASRLPPSAAAVRRQQRKLNELFAPYVIGQLAVDGDSGPLTRQMLCAARMGLGLRISATSMSEDSPEEAALFEATSLTTPARAATWSNRWVLIDKTCQVMFTGEGSNGIVDVYPTSTGESGFETTNVQAVAAFRYDPALENGGWHDSSAFPVSVDNPLNGNMYKPIYFNNGQAIHGAGYVPPTPESKGCARLFTWHHDTLLAWLGIDDVTEPTWRRSEIGVTVSVQGDHRAGP